MKSQVIPKTRSAFAAVMIVLFHWITGNFVESFSIVSPRFTTAKSPLVSIQRRPYCCTTTTTILYAMGPIARAKKMMDPTEYNRIVEQKMRQEGLTRTQAEEEYNAFLENPSFYYALDKKEEYYKSLGYKDIFEGMIGEAEKEGRGDEVRERIAKFRQTSRSKAYTVLFVFILSFAYLYNIYHDDPASFLPGLPVREL